MIILLRITNLTGLLNQRFVVTLKISCRKKNSLFTLNEGVSLNEFNLNVFRQKRKFL